MDRKSFSVYVLILPFLLASCAPLHFHQDGERARICNKLRGDLFFSDKTSNIREADIQKAQKPLVEKSYDIHDCDEI